MVSSSTFVVLLALYPQAFANIVFKWFVLYAIVLALYLFFGKSLTIGIGSVQDTKKIFIEYAFFLPNIAIFSILFFLKDKKLYHNIALGSLVFLTVSLLYVFPLIVSGSNMLRDAVTNEAINHVKVIGVPNYTLMHGYIIVLPAIFYGIKALKNTHKWLVFGISALFVFIIINTYITTSLVVTIALIVFAFMYDVKNKAKSFLFLFLVFFGIIFLHMSGVFLTLFDYLLEYFYGTPVYEKIIGFKHIYESGDVENSGGHITGRMSLHDMSWTAFSENFLIGGNSPVGGHSSMLDRLGGMGLLVFIPFIMIIISQIRMILLVIKNSEQRVYYYLGIVAGLTLLYQKGLFGQEGWLFLMVILPGLIITFKDIENLKLSKFDKLKRKISTKSENKINQNN
jgi:hypothetical protein